MSKIKKIHLTAIALGLYLMIGCVMSKGQDSRIIEGKLEGKNSIFFYQLLNNTVLIWNKKNELFKVPMYFPKVGGYPVMPNYQLIPITSNVVGDPFARRFPPYTLYNAHIAAYDVIKKINQAAIVSEKLEKFRMDSLSIFVTYYCSPDGTIQEVDFMKSPEDEITGPEFEILEKEIKTRLQYVTESKHFKEGNYIKLTSGWHFY